MTQPYDIPPPPAPVPMVTVPQSLFERMAAVYYGLSSRSAQAPVQEPVERESEPKVFDPDNPGTMLFPDVHPSWRPVGRNRPKAPEPTEVTGG